MLSSGWHWFVVIITLANIFGCFWLIYWSGKHSAQEEDQSTGHVWDEDLKELNNPLPRWWLWLFIGTIIFSLVYIWLYPGLGNYAGSKGWTQITQLEEEIAQAEASQTDYFAQFAGLSPEALVSNENALGTGGRTFANHCAMCHGSDGGGAPGFPNLRDNDWLWGGDYSAILASIQHGRQGVMPAFGASLNETQVWETVSYVQSLAGQPVSDNMANKGRQHYQVLCVACHGPDGKGNQALGAPNLTDDVWLHGASPDSIAETITKGRENNMPAHVDLIGEQRLPLVAAYVQSLGQEGNDEAGQR